jgi:glycosyltransferase involved in cell wall biosynthesis
METREFSFSDLLPALRKLVNGRPCQKKRPGREPAPMVSVIIPAHNEEGYLERTLQTLQRQRYKNFETIVIANGCEDRTADEARGRCDRLLVLSQKSLGIARNLGARMAKGELLVFLDADTLLGPSALRRIAQRFTKSHSAGTVRGVPAENRFAYKLIYALKNFVHRSSLHAGSSGVILCWKKHFEAVGGFDEGLEARENSELIKRLKRFGNYMYVNDVDATTSMRRYERRGAGRTVWLWIKLWARSLVSDIHQRPYETVR